MRYSRLRRFVRPFESAEKRRIDIWENYRYRLSMGAIPNAKLSLLIITDPSPSLYHPISFLLSRSSFQAIGSNDPWNEGSTKRNNELLPQRFGVNRNRISRERRLEAIREVFTPSCEGTSTGGMTIEGRKGHGSRNLSSVAQHCCHGCFALSQRIDGGAECCWVDDHYFSMCV